MHSLLARIAYDLLYGRIQGEDGSDVAGRLMNAGPTSSGAYLRALMMQMLYQPNHLHSSLFAAMLMVIV
jgi:hypothetical protein